MTDPQAPTPGPLSGERYRKKPVVIEAIQWTGDNLRSVITFTDGPPDTRSHHASMKWDEYADLVARDGLRIFTREDGPDAQVKHYASVGDFIIRGVQGELYACKPDIFAATYEPASLAPTAPVETSGSERERVAEQVEALADRIDDITDERHFPAFLLETAWELQRLAREEILPLLARPQPSGETREQVARLASLADDAEAMSLDIAMSNYVGTGASLASDLRAILALIRLAPTAPVEASGSERDDPDFWCRLMGEALDALDIIASDEPWSDGATSAVFAEKASATIRAKYSDLSSEPHDEVAAAYYAKKALAALRPQPSGETRGPGGYLVKDFADGWYWTPNAAIECATGSPVWSVQNARYETKAEALIRPAPVASGGQHSSGEEVAWTWLNGHVECHPADRDYSADEMVDAFMAGAGRYDRWAKALERIAGEHQHRSGYCQTDITVEPDLTAEEAQAVARDALSGTPVHSEAPVAETAGEAVAWCLQFPGKPPQSHTYATKKIAQGWADLDHELGAKVVPLYAAPVPAQDDDKLLIAIEALGVISRASARSETMFGGKMSDVTRVFQNITRVSEQALAALKSTAAKEGGE